MSFRTRLMLAFLAVVLIPLVVVAVGIRREMTARLTAQYRERVVAMADVVRADVAAAGEEISARLATLKDAMTDDNRLRAAVLESDGADRSYLRDYAAGVMRLIGLSMLQIQDETGRIVSSGHFRLEYDRLEPELPRLLASVAPDAAIVRARTPEGTLVTLARVDSVRLGGRRLMLVGGVSVEERFLARLSRDRELTVSLVTPDAVLSTAEIGGTTASALAEPRVSSGLRNAPAASGDLVLAELEIPYIAPDASDAATVIPARLRISHPLTGLAALRRSVDRWFLAATLVTSVAALLVAGWLSARLGGPLAELARKTSHLDLDRLDVKFADDRDDEIGSLSRLLGAMTERLRASATRLREAERRATVGDVARQVNHDIKNGLAPIRNVFRHLSQVAREQPAELPSVFLERQGTLESSVAYLETLAANYARLSPRLDRHTCSVNSVVRQVVRDTAAGAGFEPRIRLDESEPSVQGDAVVLRRVLENLIGNAVDSLDRRPGEVTVATEVASTDSGAPIVRILVEDTGRGMTEQELQRAFDDFYTTKAAGTGLGLSIVRRLVLDMSGSLRVASAPGTGTSFVVELPAAPPPSHRAAPSSSGAGA